MSSQAAPANLPNDPDPQQLSGIEPAWFKFFQLTHLEKVYGYLPGFTEALPAIFGTTPEAYAAGLAAFDERVASVAAGLLTDEDLAAAVDALPFRTGETVLIAGESITDDLQSWAEILRQLLAIRRPDDKIKIINEGLSAHTTAMILRRWPATLASRPDWVICALGGNDVTRVGPPPNKTVVSLDESVANLRELHRIATLGGVENWVWMTPFPVLEERVQAFKPFLFGQSSWANDDVIALADAVRQFPEPVVDLVRALGVPPAPELQGEDGIHTSLAGQCVIVTELLRVLTDHPIR